MIQDYAVSQLPAWQIIGRELLAYTVASALYPFGMKRSLKRSPRRAEQRTVVFIPGYLSNRSIFFPLLAYLKTGGVKQVLTFDYRSSLGIEQGARELKEYLRKHVRGGKVDLVCHSIGGLLARVYLQELGGARRVDRCITLGTPHGGTYNAYWVTSRIGRELRPDSSLLKRLERSRSGAKSVQFTSIVGGSDIIVIPRVFSANEETVVIPDLGHVGMLFSAATFREISERLA